MAIIPSLLKALTRPLKNLLPRSIPGARAVSRIAGMFSSKKSGHSITDIVETIKTAAPGEIATNLNQTMRTVTRMLDTEPFIVDFPKNRLLPRQLQVSGRMKSARNYWQFYQADVFDAKGNFTERRWFSAYTNTLKAFSETEDDLLEAYTKGSYPVNFSIANLTLHHVIHRRGAPFLEIQPS